MAKDIKAGVWVSNNDGKVGVAFVNTANGVNEVHIVNGVGETVTILRSDPAWTGWSVAAKDQLPATRVDHLDDAQLAALGYA